MEEDSDETEKIDVNLMQDNDLEEELMSDYESDEDFNTLYSCNICKASNMELGEFIKHTKKHSQTEKQKVLNKILDEKLIEDMAVRNTATAYGFQPQPSIGFAVPTYLCLVCGHGNLLLKNLPDHRLLHPEYLISHFCNLCEQQFEDDNGLDEHLEKHLNNNDLTCQYCSKRFDFIEDLEMHEIRHNQAEFRCVECCEHFSSKSQIMAHFSIIHTKTTRCLICKQNFETDKEIKDHFMNHATVVAVNRMIKCFPCDNCSKKYESKVGIQRHILFKHNKRQPLSCEYCAFVAYHEVPLKKHISKEHLDMEKPFNCHCGHSYVDKDNFVAHKKTHEKENKFSCLKCSLKFSNPSDLKFHLTSHAEVENLNETSLSKKTVCSFICKFCKEAFYVEEKYNVHLLKHKTAIVCSLCDKYFNDEELLSAHLNTSHMGSFCQPDLKNGVFPFKCEFCNASFKLEFELDNHCDRNHASTLQLESILYQCQMCFKEFALDSEFQEHIDTHMKSVHS